MVDEEPDTEEFYWRDEGTLHYNVTFLDEKPTRAWIPERFICHFLKSPEVEKRFLQKPKQNRYTKAMSKAKERAEAAMKMTIKDRLETYTFAHLYKGHWPAAPNLDESDVEENESRKVEAIADTLLKELDELGSIDSTDTDDERIEKDPPENENNKAKEGKIISKISDSQNFKKKVYNTKYVDDKDFIRENGAIFPFTKKKKTKKILNSVKKTLSGPKDQTSLEHAESITDFLQEKESKGIKRKKNRKLTPRKQNFEIPTHSLTDDVIDLANTDSEREGDETLAMGIAPNEDDSKADHYSEEKSTAKGNPTHSLTDDIIDLANTDSGHESDETMNIGFATKKDNGKTFHDSEEKSTAEGNIIFFPEMPNHEKKKTEKNSNDVKPLNEKEFKKAKTISKEKRINLPSKEEIFKHMDESISKVSEFIENETSAEFNEYNKSKQKKIVKTSEEPQMKSFKQNKPLSSCENNKQSKIKIETLKKNTISPAQEPSETMILQNGSNSSLKNKKQKITGTTKHTNKSLGNIKPVDNIKMNERKQPNSSFSIHIKNNAELNDEMVIDKDERGENMNKEKKRLLTLKNQNPPREGSPVKAKPNFKLPFKTNKQGPQAKTKDLKIVPETGKLKAADGKQKKIDELKENCSKKVGSGQEEKDSMNENSTENMKDEKDSMNEKTTENMPDERCVSDHKENVPEVISNDTVNALEHENENLFYVSVSDEEMDCETSNG